MGIRKWKTVTKAEADIVIAAVGEIVTIACAKLGIERPTHYAVLLFDDPETGEFGTSDPDSAMEAIRFLLAHVAEQN